MDQQRLAMVTLLVEDYDSALAFFVGALGFRHVEDTDLGHGKRWVVVRPGIGGAALLLARATDQRQRDAIGWQAGGRVTFFLQTDDIARDHALFLARGVRFREAPRREVYGAVAVFEDCCGNAWDLIEPARLARDADGQPGVQAP